MLSPESNRLDYGEQLNPPEDFELDAAIACSYSVDLNTLLAVPIALCFSDTLDGDLKGEKLALLEAIGQLKGRLKVFYQKGNIAFPSEYNRLFTLLEPCLHAIVPEGKAFSSFHPKLWLLRFVEMNKPSKKTNVVYRLIVLSRNLSFDRSWDVAATFDGVINREKAKLNDLNTQWNKFIKVLLDKDPEFEPGKVIKKEIDQIVWQSPDKFKDLELLVGGGDNGRPLNIDQQDHDVLMVVSPFVRSTGGGINGLEWLSSFVPNGEKYLLSRAEELNAVGEEKLNDWQCYAINEAVVNGEERLELYDGDEVQGQRSQNLHAKIIISQKGYKTNWHLGSANATTAALGDADNDKPRNTEMMVKLSGDSREIGLSVLMEQWVGDKEGEGLFVKHEFQPLEINESETQQALLRKSVHQLISAFWHLDCVQENEDNKYTLNLTVDMEEPINANLDVQVEQLAIPGSRKLSTFMQWENIELSNISALIPVIVTLEHDGKQLIERLIIESTIVIQGGDIRHQTILKSLVDSTEKLLDYVRLLLQVYPDKNQWIAFDKNVSGNNESSIIFSDSPIFEQLLIAASRHPNLLKRISSLIERLKSSGIEIPKDFGALWEHFEKEVMLK